MKEFIKSKHQVPDNLVNIMDDVASSAKTVEILLRKVETIVGENEKRKRKFWDSILELYPDLKEFSGKLSYYPDDRKILIRNEDKET